MPIITFVNQLDREGRDPFDLIDEIEQALALDVTPASWPIGMGRDFLGTLFNAPRWLKQSLMAEVFPETVAANTVGDPDLSNAPSTRGILPRPERYSAL